MDMTACCMITYLWHGTRHRYGYYYTEAAAYADLALLRRDGWVARVEGR